MGRIRAWLGKLMRLNGSPHGIAGGFALGVGLSLIPVPFAGMVVALALAPVLRLNPPATYLGTAVINPVTGTAFYFGELWIGLTLTGHSTPSWDEMKRLDSAGWWELFTTMLGPFAIGAFAFIAAGTVLSYATLLWATRRWQARRRHHAHHDGNHDNQHKGASAEAPAPSSDSAAD